MPRILAIDYGIKRTGIAVTDEMQIIEKFVSKFKSEFPDMSLERSDERFTSKMAFQTMIDSGLKKKQRQNKALVDEIAATIMLQDYLLKQ